MSIFCFLYRKIGTVNDGWLTWHGKNGMAVHLPKTPKILSRLTSRWRSPKNPFKSNGTKDPPKSNGIKHPPKSNGIKNAHKTNGHGSKHPTKPNGSKTKNE